MMTEPLDYERKLASMFVAGVDDVAAMLADYRARLTQPARVLAEAERLLRGACPRSGYVEVCLHGNRVSVSDRYDGLNEVVRDTLAEVYAELTEKRNG